MDPEIDLVKMIQNIPGDHEGIMTIIMRLISLPFNLFSFLFIIFVLYSYKKITKAQLYVVMISQLILWFIKNLTKRPRPFIENRSINYLECFKIDQYSFPSGHALNAFMLSFILEKNFGYKGFINILPYIVGFSRVYLGVHYPTDILGGYLLAKIMLNSADWLPKY
jgi:undecaprenyl-diphosphatase